MATAMRRVRFDFVCEETLTFHHEVPSALVGPAAAGLPDFRARYTRAVAPVMQQRQGACLRASARRCGVCGKRPAAQVLTTPMSYLHLAEEPRVVVIVTPICDADPACATRGQQQASAVVAEVAGLAEGGGDAGAGDGPPAAQHDNNNQKIPRGGPCPCGSRRKFKKCCGAAGGDAAESEVQPAGEKAEAQ